MASGILFVESGFFRSYIAQPSLHCKGGPSRHHKRRVLNHGGLQSVTKSPNVGRLGNGESHSWYNDMQGNRAEHIWATRSPGNTHAGPMGQRQPALHIEDWCPQIRRGTAEVVPEIHCVMSGRQPRACPIKPRSVPCVLRPS